MMMPLWDLLFGCWHRRRSFPITAIAKQSTLTHTYVVCLDCGKEFPYDWARMKVLAQIPPKKPNQKSIEV